MVYKSAGWLGARLTYHGSNTEVSQASLPTSGKRIRDAALSTFIHHYTFAAKSKSIKYDSRRTI